MTRVRVDKLLSRITLLTLELELELLLLKLKLLLSFINSSRVARPKAIKRLTVYC